MDEEFIWRNDIWTVESHSNQEPLWILEADDICQPLIFVKGIDRNNLTINILK